MSELKKRILISIAGVPVILFLICMSGWYFFALTLLLQTLCLLEFYYLFENKNYSPVKYFAVLGSLLMSLFVFIGQPYHFAYILIFFIVLIFAEFFRNKEKRNPLNPAINIFGFFYVTLPFILLNKLASYYYGNLVFYIIVVIWICDIMAFFGGKYLGKHKLSEISPNKTIEGAVSGLLFSLIASLAVQQLFYNSLNLYDAVIIGLIIGITGQAGDLFESMLKRFGGVKDSSSVIPGHGGVLDRFDNLIFSAPVVYVYFNFFKINL